MRDSVKVIFIIFALILLAVALTEQPDEHKQSANQQHSDLRVANTSSEEKSTSKINEDLLVVYAQDAVREKLKDPASAKFRNLFVHKARLEDKEIPVVCGEVNAKNAFGGYSGFQYFVSAWGLPEWTFLEEQIEDFYKLWNSLCTDK